MSNSPAIEAAQSALDNAAVACHVAVMLTIDTINCDDLDTLTCAAAACREASRDLDER